MSEQPLHSLILAADYRVDDVESMWTRLKSQRSILSELSAHHVVVYSSLWEPGRVLATVGIHNANSVREVLRSPAIFGFFDASGVDDIPAIFAGEVVEKIDLAEPPPGEHAVASVVVGVVTAVEDVPALMDKVHDAAGRFREAGVCKVWVYRAFDDGHEVLILQQIESEAAARRWIDHPDAAAEWMSAAGFGVYPSVFVGTLAHITSIDAADEAAN
ncbi:fatty-acid--CoA ligase [Mycolicibacterium llatzerense]|uniref:fatty-acid--CoA ligase n=1 Tax=Mycolicibacterium llatzerense TaxID=280871 RepID=UPI0008DE1BCB|nr:fatty-acid--CoA ligase [Mycolicibacterium llatzerense]